ncbi:MAG: hypothetical protein S4CHLAM81_04650 [Chlamydiales bacterium]|nr:hypothetical protein [Chlamydiales bacterium]MCH9635254.1 hypothetical protein [Chlamydiales bacterium]MCH9703459.1 NUDIX hydrolase [Chlamydiota bacterium]
MTSKPHEDQKHSHLRDVVRNLISSIAPIDALEKSHIDFAKKWIDSGAEICRINKPNLPKIHLISYFILFDQKRKSFLLVDHRKAKMWLPPGGHVDPGEHPKKTAQREAREELSIEAEFLLEDPIFLTQSEVNDSISTHTDVSLWYVLKGVHGTDFDYDLREFKRVQWYEQTQIPFELAEPHLKRFIKKLELTLAPQSIL